MHQLGDLEWIGENSARGRMSGVRFEFSTSGYGNDKLQTITVRFNGAFMQDGKLLKESTLVIRGEWEFEDFKNFVVSLCSKRDKLRK
jgi:hypothetical protein